MARDGERVAFFGGSFNPPHIGHVFAAVYALAIEPIDRVLVAPVFRHPFSKELAPFEDRLAMCEAAMRGLDGVDVTDVERELAGESLTLRTLEHLAERHPAWSMRLMIGADVVHDIPRWHRFERVAELAPPLVIGRAGVDRSDVPVARIPKVSSSEIRDAVARGDVDAVRSIVPHGVLDRIAARGLYRR